MCFIACQGSDISTTLNLHTLIGFHVVKIKTCTQFLSSTWSFNRTIEIWPTKFLPISVIHFTTKFLNSLFLEVFLLTNFQWNLIKNRSRGLVSNEIMIVPYCPGSIPLCLVSCSPHFPIPFLLTPVISQCFGHSRCWGDHQDFFHSSLVSFASLDIKSFEDGLSLSVFVQSSHKVNLSDTGIFGHPCITGLYLHCLLALRNSRNL